MNNRFSYLCQQELLDHAKHPRNYGLLQQYDFISQYHNPSCGDSVIITGSVQGGLIKELTFEGKGCMLSLAMASKLTEFCKDKALDQISNFDETIVQELLGIELGPNRMQCGMLSIKALFQGLDQIKNR